MFNHGTRIRLSHLCVVSSEVVSRLLFLLDKAAKGVMFTLVIHFKRTIY